MSPRDGQLELQVALQGTAPAMPATGGRRPPTRASKSVEIVPPVCAEAVAGAARAIAAATRADRRSEAPE